MAYNEQVISSANPLQAVWMDKPISVVLMAAADIPEAAMEVWRRRLGLHCRREVLILARKRYKARLGKVAIMPDSEAVKQTMMTNPPAAGEMFVFTDGTLPTGKRDPDTGEEIRTPNKILAYCVSVADLPGGGGFATADGGGGMYVVDYIERGKAS